MADLTETRYGMLGDELARAVQQIIAMSSRASLIVLNDVHLRLAIDYCVVGTSSPPEPPLHRWFVLLEDLFGDGVERGGPLTTRAPDLDKTWTLLARIGAGERSTVARLFLAAGTFLVSEAVTLREQVAMAAAVDAVCPADIADQPNIAVGLEKAASAGRTLVELAEPARLACPRTDNDVPAYVSLLTGLMDDGSGAPATPTDVSCPNGIDHEIDTARRPVLLAVVWAATCGRLSVPRLIRDTLDVVRDSLLNQCWWSVGGVNLVVTDLDGRLSAEVPLLPTWTLDGHDAGDRVRRVNTAVDRARELLFALAPTGAGVAVTDRQPVWMASMTRRSWTDYQLGHWDDIVTTLDFVAATLDAQRIIVATDAFPAPSPRPDSTSDRLVPVPTVLARLCDRDMVPHLTGRAVTVVYGSLVAGQRLRDHWATLCLFAGVTPGDLDIRVPERNTGNSTPHGPLPDRAWTSRYPPRTPLPAAPGDDVGPATASTAIRSVADRIGTASRRQRPPLLSLAMAVVVVMACLSVIVVILFVASTRLLAINANLVAVVLGFSCVWVICRHVRAGPVPERKREGQLIGVESEMITRS